MAATPIFNGDAVASRSAALHPTMPGLVQQLEETIKIVMDDQVARLASALEARVDLKVIDICRRVAEAEHGWKAERQERETAMMALQRDMLTLTDSAVKERELIEKVFQDLEMMRSEQSQWLLQSFNASAAGGGIAGKEAPSEVPDAIVDRKDLMIMFEECKAEICTALALKQEEELTKIHQQIRHEHKQRLDSMTLELEDHARLLTPCNMEALSPQQSTPESRRMLAHQDVHSGEREQTEHMNFMEQKLESVHNALTCHISEVQALIIGDLHAERDDRKDCLADLRTSLTASIAQSTNRIELLESDLIDVTRALKRLDQKLKDVTRSRRILQSNYTSSQATLSQEAVSNSASSSRLPKTASLSKDFATIAENDSEPNVPLIHPNGLFGSLLEAANAAGEDAKDDMDMPPKLQIELIKRAASTNPGLSSILRRARELNEV